MLGDAQTPRGLLSLAHGDLGQAAALGPLAMEQYGPGVQASTSTLLLTLTTPSDLALSHMGRQRLLTGRVPCRLGGGPRTRRLGVDLLPGPSAAKALLAGRIARCAEGLGLLGLEAVQPALLLGQQLARLLDLPLLACTHTPVRGRTPPGPNTASPGVVARRVSQLGGGAHHASPCSCPSWTSAS